ADRLRRGRPGHAGSGADDGCVSLARPPLRRPLGVDVEHEAWRIARGRVQDRREARLAGPPRAARCSGRDRGEKGGGVFHPEPGAERGAIAPHQGPPPRHVSPGRTDLDYLLSAAAVRERCAIVLAAAERGETRHFRLDAARLDEAVKRVIAVTRRRFPDLRVPLHSRWRHFDVGKIDRAALIAPGADPAERARARLDLAIVSVL